MSGKTRCLVEAGESLSNKGLLVAAFQSDMNKRDICLESRDKLQFPADKISTIGDVAYDPIIDKFDAVILDEVHFFEDPKKEYSAILHMSLTLGKIVIVGALDYNYKGRDIPIFELLSNTEGATMVALTARCDSKECKTPAKYTARYEAGVQVTEGDDKIVDGPLVSYSPRCGKHFEALKHTARK